MSGLKATPGPWEVGQCDTTYYNGPSDAGDPFIVTAPNDGVILAVVVPDVVPQVEANANLIAAAPELYEALKECAERLRKCAISGGTAEEYAAAAVERYIVLLNKANGEQVHSDPLPKQVGR